MSYFSLSSRKDWLPERSPAGVLNRLRLQDVFLILTGLKVRSCEPLEIEGLQEALSFVTAPPK